MKVKWRQHGFILFGLLVLISITHDLLHVFQLSPQETLAYGLPFAKDHLSFNKYINIFLSQAGAVLLLYLVYLGLNFLVKPKKSWLNYLWMIVPFLGLSYFLALGVNVISFYARPAYFSYAGFRILAIDGFNTHPLSNLWRGFDQTIILTGIYILYAAIRELIIYRVEKAGPHQAYRVLITNQISTFLIVFITLPVFTATFNLINNDQLYSFYFLLLTPAAMVYVTNTYWLFPANKGSYLHIPFLIRLLATTFVFNLIFCFFGAFFHWGISGSFFWGGWAIQLLIVTPLTALLYEQRKDQILQLRGAEKALTRSKADLQFLRSQINPHFLFNVLNTIYGVALREKAKDTAVSVQMLGDMMRFMLRDNHLDFIPMSTEIAYLRNYIALQKLRIETTENITVEIDINEANCGHLIAPMLLIPFVENAFKYGINPPEKSWIKVTLRCDPKQIYFEVRNSVFPAIVNDPEKEHSGIGLQNVQERLNLFYAGKHQLNYGVIQNEFVATMVIGANPIID